jgi:hypothetical protein
MMSLTAWCTYYPVVLPRRTRSTLWRHAVGSAGTIAGPCEWSTRPVLYYSCTISACPHVLQALNALPFRTSCMPMMALTLGILETCTHALETCGPSCISRPLRFFFILAPETSHRGGRVRSRRAHGSIGALPRRMAGSRAMVHMMTPEPLLAGRRGLEPLDTWAAPEPSIAGRQGPEPQDMRQHQSPPWQGGRVQYRMAHGGTWMHAPLFVLI